MIQPRLPSLTAVKTCVKNYVKTCKVFAVNIKAKRGVLKEKKFFSAAAIFLSLSVMIFLTGAIKFNNAVEVTDVSADGNVTSSQVFTMLHDPASIVTEVFPEADSELALGEHDYYTFSGFDENRHGELSVYRAVWVSFAQDNEVFDEVEVPYGSTVAKALSAAGIELTEASETLPSLDEPLYKNSTVTVLPSFPALVTADKVTRTVYTRSGTVADMIKKSGVYLDSDDIVVPPLDAEVYPGIDIRITRVSYEYDVKYLDVPFDTVTEYSNIVSMHSEEIGEEGEPGQREIIFRTEYRGGQLFVTETVSDEIVAPPENQVTLKGRALRTPYSKLDFPEIVLENGLPKEYDRIVSGKAVAYTAGSGSGTASGRKLQIGTVAVNPAVIPYGSLLYIVEKGGGRVYGAAVAADTGNLPSDIVVDLYMGNTAEHFSDAVSWGARYVDVYVINYNH
ncbi:hypothetical protein FACS189499_10070 [Clostridia bacterium]|nr:hypothetical protein FACS189499_10070 [Clostridia bacterium]